MNNHSDVKSQPEFQTAGFTLIEILISVGLLGLMVGILTATMTGTLQLNVKNQKQLDATGTAQRIMETIKGNWSTQANYDRICVANYTPPSGYAVKYTNLTSRAVVVTGAGNTGSLVYATDCATAALNPTAGTVPMRRVEVTFGSGTSALNLALDILRPAP